MNSKRPTSEFIPLDIILKLPPWAPRALQAKLSVKLTQVRLSNQYLEPVFTKLINKFFYLNETKNVIKETVFLELPNKNNLTENDLQKGWDKYRKKNQI